MKKALVMTYHLKRCKRHGGFHDFINFLEEMNYDIDWYTCPVNMSWAWHHDDRANFRNLVDLLKGLEFEENDVHVRHWGDARVIPGKILKKVAPSKYEQYWVKWKKVRKKLAPEYDVILVESSACQYIPDLRRKYTGTLILYRPSDIVCTFSDFKNANQMEIDAISSADMTLCVNELQLRYYVGIGAQPEKLDVLSNPIVKDKDVAFLRSYMPRASQEKVVLYIGVSFIDMELINSAARDNPNAEFIICGPFAEKSHDNVHYAGSISEKEFDIYLKRASVGIAAIKTNYNEAVPYGYTKKILMYMKYLLPVVATNSSNYLDTPGFFIAKDAEEFSAYISEALNYTIEQRLDLREGYLDACNSFTAERTKHMLLGIVEGEAGMVKRGLK